MLVCWPPELLLLLCYVQTRMAKWEAGRYPTEITLRKTASGWLHSTSPLLRIYLRAVYNARHACSRDGLQRRARGPASNHGDQRPECSRQQQGKKRHSSISTCFRTTTTLRSVSLLLLLRERLTLLAMQCGLVCLPFFAWSRNSFEWNAKWFI